MTAYYHKEYVDGCSINDNPFHQTCYYCNSKLSTTRVNDMWPISDAQITQVHDCIKEGYKEVHDLEDCYLNLQLDSKDIEVDLDFCIACGWWRLVKNICICAEEHQVWDIKFGCAGSLKNLDLDDINIPLSEIRSYLTAKYNKRFNVNPRVFENVVSSVFKTLGYDSYLTGYTNDGGIDIILKNTDTNAIGVQVKRYKNKIKVEQIRAFVGALVLGTYTKGIFVTTSSFQPGAIKAADNLMRTTPIELIDGDRFYTALKIAQIKENKVEAIYSMINRKNIPKLSYYGWDTPRNSL